MVTRAPGKTARTRPLAWCGLACAVTLTRLLAVPGLYMVAWSGLRETFSVLFPLVALTDAVDGWLARRLYQQSDAGRRLDSVADAAFFYSAPLWFWRLVPETASTWWPWIAMPAVPFFAGVVVKAMAGVFVAGFHLRSTRLAGLTAMAYLIWVLFGSPPPSAFYVTVAVLSVAAVWELRVAMMIFRRGR